MMIQQVPELLILLCTLILIESKLLGEAIQFEENALLVAVGVSDV